MNLFQNLLLCLMLACLAQFCWTVNLESNEKRNVRYKRGTVSVILKKKGIKAAAAAAVAAASISKKKFFPVPIPFPIPILKPPIIETIPVPIGLGHIGGFGGGFHGGFGGGGFGRK